MTIKSKISIFISIFFSVLFGLIALFIINNFSEFRKDEFEERLREEALTTIRLLVEVKEVDEDILKIIDQNTINQLYNEKTLVFDARYKLIYSSLDNMRIPWTINDLHFLKENKEFFRRQGDYEVYGLYYDSNHEDYYAIVSANDNYGKRKLDYLTSLIMVAYVLFLIVTWAFTFYLIKAQLRPLDFFLNQIKQINDLNSLTELKTDANSNNEIERIGREFNFMMHRITEVYNQQKEFSAHVSHELRTPLLRMSSQIENRLQVCSGDEYAFYQNLLLDIKQLNELLQGLLLLTRQEAQPISETESIRLDEVLYAAIDRVANEFDDIIIDFDIPDIPENENKLKVKANPVLLEIALVNLLKNAYFYSQDHKVIVRLLTENNSLSLVFQNNGSLIAQTEQAHLFEPFMRGENAQAKRGLGLGLAIVKRILSRYTYAIDYNTQDGLNTFTLKF